MNFFLHSTVSLNSIIHQPKETSRHCREVDFFILYIAKISGARLFGWHAGGGALSFESAYRNGYYPESFCDIIFET